jgi:hypothetical protein
MLIHNQSMWKSVLNALKFGQIFFKFLLINFKNLHGACLLRLFISSLWNRLYYWCITDRTLLRLLSPTSWSNNSLNWAKYKLSSRPSDELLRLSSPSISIDSSNSFFKICMRLDLLTWPEVSWLPPNATNASTEL